MSIPPQARLPEPPPGPRGRRARRPLRLPFGVGEIAFTVAVVVLALSVATVIGAVWPW